MLVSLKEVLRIAEEKQIAVGSFNTPNLESLCAVIEAAEELDLPVIVQHAQCHEELCPLSVIGPIMVDMAKKSTAKICVHLDHGETFDYLEAGLKLGFTSVMFDGSELPYEQNVTDTCRAVELAAQYSADIEAELGCMGAREFGGGSAEQDDASKIYTDPALAEEFVKKTGIDALACSFGTTHGIYLTEPKLDFTIVSSVRERTNGIPVVMHGGSGVSKADYHKAIAAGVRKINYFTYMDKAGGLASESYLCSLQENEQRFYSSIRLKAQQAMKENVMDAMRTFALMDV